MGSSLFKIMNMGSESLANSRVGVDVTGHNIANAHTAGYSRQRIQVENKDPLVEYPHSFGDGARIRAIERVHDKFLETQLREEYQTMGAREMLTSGLAKLESFFNPELNATVRDRLDQFTNSMRELSSYPEEISMRVGVVESANALAQSLQVAHANVAQLQTDLSIEAQSHVVFLNQKIREVSELNQKILEASSGPTTSSGDLLDKRDEAIKSIAELMDVQVYHNTDMQVTLRGPGGILLVDTNQASTIDLVTRNSNNGHPRLVIQDPNGHNSWDMTDKLDNGKLAGLFAVRDRHAQVVRDSLNEMASGLANSINTIHRKGYGLGEFATSPGRDFFVGADNPDVGEAAANIAVSQLLNQDPSALSLAMTPHSPGDNIIGNEIVRAAYEKVFDNGNSTIAGFYDRFVGKIGLDSMRSKEELEASKIVMSQLQSQKSSVSGVSMDEEAANLLKYQHLFQASSKVITTVDEMLKTVIDLKR